jgi:hypothetical protein
MKPSKEEIIQSYNDKINMTIQRMQPFQEYYESNKNYKGKKFEKSLALMGAKRELQIFHHKIKCWKLQIKRLNERI